MKRLTKRTDKKICLASLDLNIIIRQYFFDHKKAKKQFKMLTDHTFLNIRKAARKSKKR